MPAIVRPFTTIIGTVVVSVGAIAVLVQRTAIPEMQLFTGQKSECLSFGR